MKLLLSTGTMIISSGFLVEPPCLIIVPAAFREYSWLDRKTRAMTSEPYTLSQLVTDNHSHCDLPRTALSASSVELYPDPFLVYCNRCGRTKMKDTCMWDDDDVSYS